MPTLLTHIEVKPDAIARWEEILQLMVQHTHGDEPDMLRYEYWRGEERGKYYALLAYPTAAAFYAHQGSDYHDEFLDDFTDMFAAMRMEWVDPVTGGGSGLPPTENDPLPADTPQKIRDQLAIYPILVADWWHGVRKRD
ncbi:antibiotic biosynthesis monooxygenase family protein [Sphingomonas sp. 1P06PA]|uniref:putative quinol monooxygenase n=1 Tax=Sphingomonas sp. 1P06PA TaxID=554121 RepID=UPI0039A56631